MATKPEVKLPIGVEVRGNSIRICFRYKNVFCRETVAKELTKAHLNYASRRRSEILRKIEDREFNYKTEFPDSKMSLKFESEKPTCRECFEKLIDKYNRSTKKQITKYTYLSIIRSQLLDYFESYTIDELTPNLLKQYILSLSFTRKYINQIMIQIKAIIEDALNDGYISENPLHSLAINKLIAQVATESKYKVNPFNSQERDAIIASCSNQVIKSLITLGFYSGMRIGELIALRCEDISSDHIHVRRNRVNGELTTPKTASGARKILKLPAAHQALEDVRKITGSQEWVFVNKLNEPYSNSNSVLKSWRIVLTKANVAYRNQYQMRHTYASMLLSNGENLLWVASQMGHIDTEMIIKIYGKWIPDNSKKGGYELKGKY